MEANMSAAEQKISSEAEQQTGKLVIDKVFRVFPPRLFELHHLKFLALNSNYVDTLPPEIGRLSRLESLWIDWNSELREVPPSISQLVNLKKLMLVDNRITSLPEEIGQLSKLEWLGVTNNELKSLPKSLFSLSNLRTLELQKNRLKELPTELGQLSNLEQLSVQNNKLDNLPTSLCSLLNLRKLELQGNRLVALPVQMGALLRLEKLLVQNNQLTDLPVSMCNLSSLKELWIYGNPLPVEVEEQYQEGIGSLRAHLERKSRQTLEKIDQQLTSDQKEKIKERVMKRREKQKEKEKEEVATYTEEVYSTESVAPTTFTNTESRSDPLYLWLTEINLESIYQELRDLGASEVEDLQFLKEKDLAHLKPLARRKLFTEVEKYFSAEEVTSKQPNVEKLELENKALREEVKHFKEVVLEPKQELPSYLKQVEENLREISEDNTEDLMNVVLKGDKILTKLTQAKALIETIKALDSSSCSVLRLS